MTQGHRYSTSSVMFHFKNLVIKWSINTLTKESNWENSVKKILLVSLYHNDFIHVASNENLEEVNFIVNLKCWWEDYKIEVGQACK